MQHIDILVLTETKLDDTFATVQFLVNDFSEPYRLDRNRKRGRVMVYIREDIPSKLLDKHVFPYDMEGLFIELNFRKCKWLLFGKYHPTSQADIYYFDNLDKAFDTYSSYEKHLLIGDFNTETSEPRIDSFIYEYDLQNLVKQKTCFKSVENPSCIDLILTNNAMDFQNTTTVSTGLSDLHKLVLTVLKTRITKGEPQKITYRDYKNFDSVRFNGELKYVLEKEKITFLRILNQHAPLKSKLLRTNHASYIYKPLRKAIMKTSYLKNLYYKRCTDHSLRNYKKQKNYCSRLYKKERKNFFNKLSTSFVSDNKLFWKTVKPFFSNNGSHRGNTKLLEGDKLLQDNSEVAEELNNFFKEAISTLDFNENSYIINLDSINISDPIEKAISKYKFHLSILLINDKI